MTKILFAALAVTLATAPGAFASSSAWFETEGGRVRIVTAGLPDAKGALPGILEIDLLPGWKTYWRDPGDAGVPPTVDVTRSTSIASVEMHFPAPGRHDEGDFTWAGYDQPVALPLTFQASAAGAPVLVDTQVFLGICQTICIPVKAELVLDPASDADNADDAAQVKAAFAALPAPATSTFGAAVVSRIDGKLIVQATVPGDAAGADLFVASNDDFTLSQPERSETDGRLLFSIDIDGPDTAPAGSALPYTLVTGAGAVSGVLTGF